MRASAQRQPLPEPVFGGTPPEIAPPRTPLWRELTAPSDLPGTEPGPKSQMRKAAWITSLAQEEVSSWRDAKEGSVWVELAKEERKPLQLSSPSSWLAKQKGR